MRSFGITLVAVSCLVSAVVAEAGLLPTKASQLVTLGAVGTCTIAANPALAAALQVRVTGDGSTSAFVIPPKQVLVLTDIEVSAKFLSPGHVFLGNVIVGTDQHSNLVAYRYAPSDASGSIALRFTPESGIVVKSGSVACIQLFDTDVPSFPTGPVGYAHGFFAPDK